MRRGFGAERLQIIANQVRRGEQRAQRGVVGQRAVELFAVGKAKFVAAGGKGKPLVHQHITERRGFERDSLHSVGAFQLDRVGQPHAL